MFSRVRRPEFHSAVEVVDRLAEHASFVNDQPELRQALLHLARKGPRNVPDGYKGDKPVFEMEMEVEKRSVGSDGTDRRHQDPLHQWTLVDEWAYLEPLELERDEVLRRINRLARFHEVREEFRVFKEDIDTAVARNECPVRIMSSHAGVTRRVTIEALAPGPIRSWNANIRMALFGASPSSARKRTKTAARFAISGRARIRARFNISRDGTLSFKWWTTCPGLSCSGRHLRAAYMTKPPRNAWSRRSGAVRRRSAKLLRTRCLLFARRRRKPARRTAHGSIV